MFRKIADSPLFVALVLLASWAFAGYVWFVRPPFVSHPAYVPITGTLAVLLIGHLIWSIATSRPRKNGHKFTTIAEITSYDQLEEIDEEVERHRHR